MVLSQVSHGQAVRAQCPRLLAAADEDMGKVCFIPHSTVPQSLSQRLSGGQAVKAQHLHLLAAAEEDLGKLRIICAPHGTIIC